MFLQYCAPGVTMWISFCPLVSFLLSLVSFFVALHGPLSRPLADPSRASSNALVALRRSSCPFVDIFLSLVSFFVALHGPLSSLFQPLESLRGPPSRPLADPSRASSNAFVALRRSSCPFVDIFLSFVAFVALHGPLSSLFQPLGVPSRTPLSRPLADPSRASSNPFVALRRSSWPFVDIFLSFRVPSWIPFEKCGFRAGRRPAAVTRRTRP